MLAPALTNYLTFSSTTGIVVGMTVKNTYNPGSIFAGSMVSGVGPTTVAINTFLLVDVQIGDVIQFDNVNAIPSGSTVKSVDSATQITIDMRLLSTLACTAAT